MNDVDKVKIANLEREMENLKTEVQNSSTAEKTIKESNEAR